MDNLIDLAADPSRIAALLAPLLTSNPSRMLAPLLTRALPWPCVDRALADT